MKVLEGLNQAEFCKAFLEAYLADGFTTMTKREIDLLVLRLLVELREGCSWEMPPSAFDLAQLLRAKKSRVRSMMDELSFRNMSDEENAKTRLKSLIVKQTQNQGDALTRSGNIRLQIEDGFLREYAKNLVQIDFGIVDTSFDRSIINLSAAKFLSLIEKLLTTDQQNEIQRCVKNIGQPSSGENQDSLWRTFLKSVAKGSGEQLGKTVVRLGLAALTGGVSEVPALIDGVSGVLSTPVQGAASGGVLV